MGSSGGFLELAACTDPDMHQGQALMSSGRTTYLVILAHQTTRRLSQPLAWASHAAPGTLGVRYLSACVRLKEWLVILIYGCGRITDQWTPLLFVRTCEPLRTSQPRQTGFNQQPRPKTQPLGDIAKN